MYNIGIIGCGKISEVHARCIQETNLFKIVAICDIDKNKLKSFSAFIDVPYELFETDNYLELLAREDIEAVIITVPTKAHLEIVQKAVELNKHILVEKPLGVDVSEVDQLVKIAIDSKVIILPSLQYHFSSAFINLLSWVQSQSLDGTKFITLTENRGNFLLPWFYDSSKSGGAINDKLIHFFDIVTSLFYPSIPKTVYSIGGQHKIRQGSEIEGLFGAKYILDKNDVVDHAMIVIEFEDGKKTSINLNMYQKMPYEGSEITIVGVNGNYVKISNLDTADSIVTHNFEGDIKSYKILNTEDVDNHGVSHPGVKNMYRNFFDCIKVGKQDFFDWKTLRYASIIPFAAQKSIDEKRVVDIEAEYFDAELEAVFETRKNHFKPILQEYPMVEVSKLQEKNAIIRRNWLRRLIRFRRKPKTAVLRINRRDLQAIVQKATANFDIDNMLFKSDLVVELVLPWMTIYIAIKEGKIAVRMKLDPEFETTPKLNIKITEKGYLQLATGASLNRLYITKQFLIEGDIDKAKEYQELFVNILKGIREFVER